MSNPACSGDAPTVGITRLPGEGYALASADGQMCAYTPTIHYSSGFPQPNTLTWVGCDPGGPGGPLARPAVGIMGA